MDATDRRPGILSETDGVIVIGIDHGPCSPEQALFRFDALTESCLEIAASDRVRVVVCRCGAGPGGFAALETYRTMLTAANAGSTRHASLVEALAGMPQPVIVAIDGDAVAMELEVALAGDIRVCSEGSWFGLPQIIHGEIPSFGGTQRLARLVGKGKAMEMILTGAPIDASAAYDIGLVNKVAPTRELDAMVMKLAAAMAAKGPIALQFAKEAVNAGVEMPMSKGLRLEADLYFLLHTTRDRSEGIRAFQEKRRPRFEGR